MHSFVTHPLLAAGFDWVHVVVPFIVLLVAVIKQLFEAGKPKNGQGVPRPVKPQQPAQPRPMPAAGQQADPLRSQVEEFLRRASKPQQPAEQAAQKSPQRPPSEIELLVDDSPQPKEQRPLSNKPRSDGKRPDPFAAGDKRRAARRPQWRKTVADHVAEHVSASTQSLAQKTSRLGQRIASEDQQFDEKLKAKFDHTVGTLAESTVQLQEIATPAPPTPAAQIAAMLANPEGVRQAVVLNEILQRPTDRW